MSSSIAETSDVLTSTGTASRFKQKLVFAGCSKITPANCVQKLFALNVQKIVLANCANFIPAKRAKIIPANCVQKLFALNVQKIVLANCANLIPAKRANFVLSGYFFENKTGNCDFSVNAP